MNMSNKQAIARTQRPHIAELEKDFGVIRATRQKVKALIPDSYEPEAKGFCICAQLHYDNPTFSVSIYANYGMIPQPRWALFEVVGGKWIVLEFGDYALYVNDMLDVLISVFGGERG